MRSLTMPFDIDADEGRFQVKIHSSCRLYRSLASRLTGLKKEPDSKPELHQISVTSMKKRFFYYVSAIFLTHKIFEYFNFYGIAR